MNPAIAPVLQLYPLPTRQTAAQAAQGIGRVDVTNETPGHENYFVGRVDYTLTPSTNLFVRYTLDRASVFEPNSGSAIPLWNSSDDSQNHYVTAELRQAIRPTMANSVRFGGTRTEEEATRTDLDNGLLTFFPGRQSGSVAPGLRRDGCRRQSGAAVHPAADARHSSATISCGAAAGTR